jgi:hypothetical protein
MELRGVITTAIMASSRLGQGQVARQMAQSVPAPVQLLLTLQLQEDNYKSAKPAIATSGVDQFAGLCL